MSEFKGPRELPGHDYDGIKELDNPTPKWWQAVFYASILFGVGYFAYYHLYGGPTQSEELAAEMTHWSAVQAEHLKNAKVDPATLEALLKDASALEKGKLTFAGKCASCHGDHGQGLIGPNLTDEFWIHGDGKPAAIYEVVRNGVAEKGMPPWGTMLQPDELTTVAVYVRSLRGTNPAGAKAPQGTVVHD